MKRAQRSWLFGVPCLLFLPTLCLANPSVPLPFQPTFPDFLVFLALFVPILLVEAAVLKSFMQADPYLRHLRRVFYPNLISSAVGSVLYGMVIGPFYFARNWDLDLGLPSFSLDNLFTWGFYLIVAVAVEFPVVYYLYSKNVSLTRALLMTCAMNTVSYSLLMIVYGVFT